MDRYDLMSSADIKAEISRLRAEQDRPELAPAARDAAHERIDAGLTELERRNDL